MTEKILEVFYDTNALPYKDSAREVHFPIVGTTFTGSSNTTQIRFFVRDIGGVANTTWVAVTKLPSGKKLYKILDSVTPTDSESYVCLMLSNEYTQEKGDIYVALNGYQGGVELNYDSDTHLYSISGTPVIMATGNIKIAVAYTPYTEQGYGDVDILSVQQALALVSGKLNALDGIWVVENINEENATSYDIGQIIYSKTMDSNHNQLFEVIEQYGGGKAFFPKSLFTYLKNIAEISLTSYPVYTYDLGVDGNNKLYLNLLYHSDTTETTKLLSVDMDGIITFEGTLANVYKKTDIDTFLATKLDKKYGNGLRAYTHNGITQDDIEIKVYDENATLPIRDSSGGLRVPVTPTLNEHATSKKYVDDKIAEFKENEISVVNTTTYPTLDDFLDSTGEDGLIYLYPIDTTDLNKGYYRYVWENNTWLSLGTTEIDLSDYYTSTQVDNLLSGKADKSTTLSGYGITNAYTKTETDTLLGAKQDTLVSGTNIKTINNTTLLGSGNYAFDSAFNELSTNALENQVVAKEFREINYEIAMIREALFEVVLSEIDYSVDYAMTYVVPDSLTDTDGTHRVVYSETQLKTMSGNSIVDNQLCNAGHVQFSTIPNYFIYTLVSSPIVGHKYLVFNIKPKSSTDNSKFRINRNGSNTSLSLIDDYIITEATTNADWNINAGSSYYGESCEYDNYPQCIDLTQMFGAGNEPTTTDDVRIQWLLSRGYSAYNTGSLLSTSVSGLTSKDSNYNVLSTITLPTTELKSAGNVNDYIEVVEGSVVEGEQRYNLVKHLPIGIDLPKNRNATKNSYYSDLLGLEVYTFNKNTLTDFKNANSYGKGNIICDKLEIVAYSSRYTISIVHNIDTEYYYVFFSSGTTNEQATTLINSLTFYYELATEPTPTTIATDLTFEQVSLIIQQGGTINTNFTNVPPNVTTTFVVKKAVGE